MISNSRPSRGYAAVAVSICELVAVGSGLMVFVDCLV